jgi:hypothetical protein
MMAVGRITDHEHAARPGLGILPQIEPEIDRAHCVHFPPALRLGSCRREALGLDESRRSAEEHQVAVGAAKRVALLDSAAKPSCTRSG